MTRTDRLGLVLLVLPLCLARVGAQVEEQTPTRQEILRGTITPEREWWDVLHYDLSVQFMPETRSLKGSNVITSGPEPECLLQVHPRACEEFP